MRPRWMRTRDEVGLVGRRPWRRCRSATATRAFKNKPNIYDFAPGPRNDHLEIDILEPSPGRRNASVTDTDDGDFKCTRVHTRMHRTHEHAVLMNRNKNVLYYRIICSYRHRRYRRGIFLFFFFLTNLSFFFRIFNFVFVALLRAALCKRPSTRQATGAAPVHRVPGAIPAGRNTWHMYYHLFA